ncbi:MAG TPA: condensation domain-containing protein, partial [Burkholderiales bacterium]|nr:condensation domain-containing protein [Burkholderiales bacterium]
MSEIVRTIAVDFDPFAESECLALPLTGPQREIWAATQQGSDASCAYNQCFALTLRGALSVESLARALHEVTERHAALRARLDPNGEGQRIAAAAPPAMPVDDLSSHHPEQRHDAVARILREEASRPLNLCAGPPLRARLVRESPDLHRLILTVHHIVCDGWSSAVLLADLGRLYAADRHGLTAQLPVAASYRKYLADEAERTGTAAARVDEDYWASQYADHVPVLDLPADGSRPALKTYNGARKDHRIEETLYRSVKAMGARHGCTLFVTLLAAFEALLLRLSGQEDFVVGIPMAGQALLENAHLVGHCVNMVPLRCRVEPAATFEDHLKRVRESFLEAQLHQQVTFGSLLRRLNVPRDPGRTPLVAVTFNIDRIGAPFDFGNELELLAVESARKRFVNFELSINAVDSGTDLVLECEYNTDLYSADTIDRWLCHYRVLLQAIAERPGQRLDELPLLTEMERRRLIFERNETPDPPSAGTTLHELVEIQARRTPDAIAVVTEHGRLSYRELDTRASQLAHWLRQNGVSADTPIPICAERSLEMVVGLLGILKAGAGYVPIDPELPSTRMEHILDEIDGPILLTQDDVAARLPLQRARFVCLDSDWPVIGRSPATAADHGGAPETLAYVIYTSGSTGRPKGVMVTHRAICNHMHWMQRVYPLTPADVVLQKTGYGFDASVWEFFAPLMAGARLVMARPGGHLDPGYLADAILSYGVTRLQLVPSQLRLLLEDPAFWSCAPPLTHVFCGGEPLTAELCEEFYRRMPHASLHNLYGPTECTVDATAWDVPRSGIPPHVPIGRPID